MGGKHPHLPLVKYTIFSRKKKRGFGYKGTGRNAEEFYKKESEKLRSIGKTYEEDREKFSDYFDPSLIFKITLTDTSISDTAFRKDLGRVDIETISSASNRSGYWVAFTDDVRFDRLKMKLRERVSKNRATFVDMIGSIDDIPPEEKLDKSLRKRPPARNMPEYLNVEIWRMEDRKLDTFLSGLSRLVTDNNGQICDRLTTDSFCILRIRCDGQLLSKITKLREVSHVGRLAEPQIEAKLDSDIESFDVGGMPHTGKPGILIADSGINDHPLLKDAIASRDVFPSKDGQIGKGFGIDDVGHGTMVAGIALYGSVERHIHERRFVPQFWLHSAKVMYRDDSGNAVFHRESLLENQLSDAIEHTVNNHPHCKIVNVSLGDSSMKMWKGQRQFRIASLIDELSFKHSDILFTIAAGNNLDDVDESEKYPDCLTEDSPRVKVIDPATSIHGITVGSVFPLHGHGSDYPSPFTRVGPGLQDSIKPEVVDYGGGCEQDLVTINPRWLDEGRLFTLERGTSFSAPRIAHMLARLTDSFPNASRNLLKALLLSSATVPAGRPPPFVDGKGQNILNVYGYGRPDLDRALYSESNRVLLTHDGKIDLDYVELFRINLPKKFLMERGRRKIEVTLTFDPPTNRNRADYLGVLMEYRLFKNIPAETVQKAYENNADEKNVISEQVAKKEIKMWPKLNMRKNGAHQKAFVEYKKRPEISTEEPLVLAVICKKKWYNQDNYQQPYAVVVTFMHEQEMDLYNMIRLKNTVKTKIR